MSYLSPFSTRRTAQDQPIPGSAQVPNSAGGYAWAVDDWTRLRRFLILGAEGGSAYAGERELVAENADVVLRCLRADGARTVREIVDVSTAGRAPKNDPAIFALALAASKGDDATRRLALERLPDVCRIGTHLFMFCGMIEQHRGWGRGLRKAVARWYTTKSPDDLAYQAVKYRQRNGWTHRDVLRLSHPGVDVPVPDELRPITAWLANKPIEGTALPDSILAYEMAQRADGSDAIVELLRTFGSKLPREAILPEHLTAETWEALLVQGMPMTALIRNLPTMTRIGLLTSMSHGTQLVLDQLADGERLRRARVHPIQVLAALLTYAGGCSIRGSAMWAPVSRIVDALDAAFYMSFDNVPATGKRYLLALDVSGSMNGGMVGGIPGLTPRVASSAMAMVTAATGDPYEVIAFTDGNRLDGYSNPRTGRSRFAGGMYDLADRDHVTTLPLSPRQRLNDICHQTDRLPMGGTDCALPMLYAKDKHLPVDVFAIFTDNETWAGGIHPAQALVEYRRASGINARLAVVCMTSSGFSIADPQDAGMMDFVGFDTSTPAVMQEFAEGRL